MLTKLADAKLTTAWGNRISVALAEMVPMGQILDAVAVHVGRRRAAVYMRRTVQRLTRR